jgi:hypothetical protein
MATSHQRIAEKLLAKLAGSKEVNPDHIELLHACAGRRQKTESRRIRESLFLSADSGDK